MTNIYYATERPISIGTHPKLGLKEFHNYETKEYVPAIDRKAWGYLEYYRWLNEDEIADYELVPHPLNAPKPTELLEKGGEKA